MFLKILVAKIIAQIANALDLVRAHCKNLKILVNMTKATKNSNFISMDVTRNCLNTIFQIT